MKKRTNKNTAKPRKKHTITICSSASFYPQVVAIETELKRMGFNVLIPLTANKMKKTGDFNVERYKTWFADANTYARKTFLTKHHFHKVVKGDSVLVLNYEKNGKQGYIGGAVLSEMAIALHFGKKIYVLNPLQEDVGYKEELLGMMPVILNGNLSLIKK
jgi:hypothetical protein